MTIVVVVAIVVPMVNATIGAVGVPVATTRGVSSIISFLAIGLVNAS